jgi:4a-hydroxytetrahydrobiopterin dehydratase
MSTTTLASRRCAPCGSGTPALPTSQIHDLLKQAPGWSLTTDGKRITRSWRVKDFMAGLDFFRRIADVAEAEDHHPDLHLVGYRNVTIELWTHAVGGLTENDMILAAKINELPVELKA